MGEELAKAVLDDANPSSNLAGDASLSASRSAVALPKPPTPEISLENVFDRVVSTMAKKCSYSLGW